jgi:hypothetical protein
MPLTMEDLERRTSRLEEDRQEFMATIQAINTPNQAVARLFQFFRDAIDHREELGRGALSWWHASKGPRRAATH